MNTESGRSDELSMLHFIRMICRNKFLDKQVAVEWWYLRKYYLEVRSEHYHFVSIGIHSTVQCPMVHYIRQSVFKQSF